MIERILNKYFINKYKRHIQGFLLYWYIDSRFIESKNGYIELQIKKPKYKDETYKCIYLFYKDKGLEYILQEDKMFETMKERVDKYLKEN